MKGDIISDHFLMLWFATSIALKDESSVTQSLTRVGTQLLGQLKTQEALNRYTNCDRMAQESLGSSNQMSKWSKYC